MGLFGAGLVQGAQQSQQAMLDLENQKQQAELLKHRSKLMKLEAELQEKQLGAMTAIPDALFRKPQQMPVQAQGPGAPVQLPVEESDDFLRSMTPGEQASGRWLQEVQERGPGAFKEGPQPTGMAEIPGTAGPLAGVSPQLQDVYRQMLIANGGNSDQAFATLAKLGVPIGNQPPVYQAFDQDKDIFQMNAQGGPQVIRKGTPKPAANQGLVNVAPGNTVLDPVTRQPVFTAPDRAKPQGLMNVSPGSTVLDPETRQPVYTAPDRPEKPPSPKIESVDTPEGKQFVNVSPTGVQPIGQPIKTAPGSPKAVDTENAIALEMFGQDYYSLAQPARAEVNKRIQQDKLSLYEKQADVMVAAAGERERTKQSIPEKPSGAEREKLIAGVNALDQLNTVADLYDPSLVGPSAGAMSELRASLPEKWGGLSPKQAQLYAALSTFKNRLTNLISGAAVSPDEAARLAAEMPQPNQEPAVFEERWVNSYRNAQMLEERRRQTYQGTGVDVSGAPALPQPHKRFTNKFTENIFPSTVVGPPQNGPKAKPPVASRSQQAAPGEDPRIGQLGPGGKLGYEAAEDKEEFLTRYFTALEGKQRAAR